MKKKTTMKNKLFILLGIIFIVTLMNQTSATNQTTRIRDDFECGTINCYSTNWSGNWSISGSGNTGVNIEGVINGTYSLQIDNDLSGARRYFNITGTATSLNISMQLKLENVGGTDKFEIFYNNGTAQYLIANLSDGNNDDNIARTYFVNLQPFGYSQNSSLFLNRTGGGQKGWIDDIIISYTSCNPNWSVQYTICNTTNNRTKYYIDLNSCGTNITLPADNGTIEGCDYCTPNFICQVYNESCGDIPPQPAIITCSALNNTNYYSCCLATNLSEDCNFTGDINSFSKLCGNITLIMSVPSYPYVDFNTTYPIDLLFYQNGNLVNATDFRMNMTSNIFNFTFNPSTLTYELDLIFTEEGDYPFTIYALYPYDKITNITGTLLVREPFNITIELFKMKDQTPTANRYENDFAYILAEIPDRIFGLNTELERFIAPIFFKEQFDYPVFHAEYEDGIATLKLWEKGNYALRLVDGVISFNNSYAIPNIEKTYGTHIYLGEMNISQENSYKIYVSDKEISQYTWLLNWALIILLILCFVGSVFLFFIVPSHPSLSVIFGLGMSVTLLILRVLIWFFKGI